MSTWETIADHYRQKWEEHYGATAAGAPWERYEPRYRFAWEMGATRRSRASPGSWPSRRCAGNGKSAFRTRRGTRLRTRCATAGSTPPMGTSSGQRARRSPYAASAFVARRVIFSTSSSETARSAAGCSASGSCSA